MKKITIGLLFTIALFGLTSCDSKVYKDSSAFAGICSEMFCNDAVMINPKDYLKRLENARINDATWPQELRDAADDVSVQLCIYANVKNADIESVLQTKAPAIMYKIREAQKPRDIRDRAENFGRAIGKIFSVRASIQ